MERQLSIAIIIVCVSVGGTVTGRAEGNAQDELKAEISALRAELAKGKADRDRLLVRVVELTDELHRTHDANRKLEEQHAELVARWSRATMVLRGVNGDATGDDQRQFAGHALILDVRRRFCEISVGSDEGLQVGQRLDVVRGDTVVAQIIIRRTDPDRAVGEAIGIKSPRLEKGDVVRSRFQRPMPPVKD